MKSETIIYWVVSLLSFRRNEIPVEKKISLGNSSKIRREPKPLTVKKHEDFIAVDETLIKINGKFQAAIDVESREVLAVWITGWVDCPVWLF